MSVDFQGFSTAFCENLHTEVSDVQREGKNPLTGIEKNKISDACLKALKTLSGKGAPVTIEEFAKALAQPQTGENKVLQTRIAEALYGTPLYENASHSVRRQIDSAMGWSGTWVRAKLSGFIRMPSNFHAYGWDDDKRQSVLANAAIASYDSVEGETGKADEAQAEFLSKIEKHNSTASEEEVINPKQAKKFYTEVFLREWKESIEEEEREKQAVRRLEEKNTVTKAIQKLIGGFEQKTTEEPEEPQQPKPSEKLSSIVFPESEKRDIATVTSFIALGRRREVPNLYPFHLKNVFSI